MATFSDADNDQALFIGWHDYASAGGSQPIEAQMFIAWYLEKSGHQMVELPVDLKSLLGDVARASRRQQKRKLRAAIEVVRKHHDVMTDPRTDLTPLVCSNDHG